MPYSDMTDRQPWEREAVDGVTAAGIMRGYPDGTFQPDGLMRRVEVAAALLRLYRAAAMQPPPRETTAEMLARVRKSVCRVSGLGTAACIAPGVLMTDWHVIRYGNVRVSPLSNFDDRHSADWLKFTAYLDFATISDPLYLPPLPLAKEPPRYGDTLWCIGCGATEPGTPIRLTVGAEVIDLFADSGSTEKRRLLCCSGATQDGDSGAPVVNERGEYVSPLLTYKPGASRSGIAPLDVTTSWLRAHGYVA